MKAPLSTFKVPSRHFDHINIDLVGPLPPSQGYTYLFTIIDRFTRWPEAIPLSDTSASTCAQALVSLDIVVRSAWLDFFRSRCTVHIQAVDHSFTVTWNEAHQDHLISSTGQWNVSIGT